MSAGNSDRQHVEVGSLGRSDGEIALATKERRAWSPLFCGSKAFHAMGSGRVSDTIVFSVSRNLFLVAYFGDFGWCDVSLNTALGVMPHQSELPRVPFRCQDLIVTFSDSWNVDLLTAISVLAVTTQGKHEHTSCQEETGS